MTVLAQLPPPGPGELFSWLTCAVAVLAIYYLVLRIVKEHRRQPAIDVELTSFARHERVSQLELKLPTLATRDEIQALEHRLDGRRSKDVADLYAELRRQNEGTTDQLADIRENIAALEADSKTHGATLAEHGRKLDLILQRLPRHDR